MFPLEMVIFHSYTDYMLVMTRGDVSHEIIISMPMAADPGRFPEVQQISDDISKKQHQQAVDIPKNLNH